MSLPASTLTKSLIQERSAADGRLARVEREAERPHVGQQLALVVDRLGQRARVARERMAPARLGKALDERLGLRVEVEKAHVPVEGAQTRDRVREPGEPRRDLGVERDRDAVAAGLREIARRRLDERQRQVVDRVIAGILERAERDVLAGA